MEGVEPLKVKDICHDLEYVAFRQQSREEEVATVAAADYSSRKLMEKESGE